VRRSETEEAEEGALAPRLKGWESSTIAGMRRSLTLSSSSCSLAVPCSLLGTAFVLVLAVAVGVGLCHRPSRTAGWLTSLPGATEKSVACDMEAKVSALLLSLLSVDGTDIPRPSPLRAEARSAALGDIS